ncbi:hypothetical protein CDD82_6918 [Ophiocordyceps australis]|uniref:Nuclear speckle splicing regulatory protein 1 N-terminal domain-containing protein n=1 Tax=Ophiocordyceps australis TaxID=1399860 RepID=A0A2C5XY50_9HYPO|nr:hypothetical protein CDD82_6918 [Ophiocordyceps australis]
MSKPGVTFGLGFGKKAPVPRKTKAIFGDDDDDDDNGDNDGADHGRGSKADTAATSKAPGRQRPRLGTDPPKLKAKTQASSMFGDLSASRTSRKNAQTAQDVDPSVYEYDAVYDSMKPKKHEATDQSHQKPQYMDSMLQAAEVRKRDKLIAEEKKIARERAAEGDEFADKEKFVTAAYKRQQEENRRIEEEEKRREEQEARENKGKGMAAFYKDLLDRDEERHAAVVKAAQELASKGPREPQAGQDDDDDDDEDREKAEAAKARKLRQEGIDVEINEDGQVVDKRQLLRSGLNVYVKTKEAAEPDMAQARDKGSPRGAGGDRQTSRQQESRMFEDQLEQLLKRSRGDDDDHDDDQDEQQTKSRKTER